MLTAISSFLFNRYSLFFVVLVVIIVLVGAGKLIWNRYTIGFLVILGLCIGLWSWHDKLIKDDRVAVVAPYIKLIDDNNKAAEAKFKEETDKVAAVTAALKTFSDQQEKTNATNTQTITTLNTKLRATRLRDPYSQTRCSGGSAQSSVAASAPSGATDGAETSGLLSEQTSNNLWDFAFESDRINVAYIACRADTYKVREALIAETDLGGIVLAMAEWSN